MSAPFGTPEHWRERAAEARAKAKLIADLDTKLLLGHIADNFEEIARVTEATTRRHRLETETPIKKAVAKRHR
jgi:hypothetical protein